MRQIPAYIVAIMVAVGVLSFTTNALRDEPEVPRIQDPLANSLATVYRIARKALIDHRFDDFETVAHKAYVEELNELSRRRGFISLKTYLGRQAFYWPDIDTLTLTELQLSVPYARLTYLGAVDRWSRAWEQVIFTFLLFRLSENGWLLAGMGTLRKPRRDRFGYEMNYHETELPPNLRLPRQF